MFNEKGQKFLERHYPGMTAENRMLSGTTFKYLGGPLSWFANANQGIKPKTTTTNTTINIKVTAPDSTTASHGKAVVQAIRNFERTTGTKVLPFP
jgi:hypothetical protein